jgi:hypothetical protein
VSRCSGWLPDCFRTTSSRGGGKDRVDRHGLCLGDLLAQVVLPGKDREILRLQRFPVRLFKIK